MVCIHYLTGFAPDQSEVGYLKIRVQEEEEKAARAQQARRDLEVRCQMAERERDVYRLLARRWQSRLQAVLEEQRNRSSSAEHTSIASASAFAALQAELEGEVGHEDIEEEEDAAMMEEDEEDESGSTGYAAMSHDNSMEEVDDEHDEENGAEEEAYFSCNQAGHESSDHSVEMSDVEDGLESAGGAHMMTGGDAGIEAQKVRAVSIASDDL